MDMEDIVFGHLTVHIQDRISSISIEASKRTNNGCYHQDNTPYIFALRVYSQQDLEV